MHIVSIIAICGLVVSTSTFAVERTDMGICGGRANYYAWDTTHHMMYAGVESAMNLFKSADSGKTWSLAYPYDSLKAGWSNDCRVIKSAGGVTVAVVGGGQKVIVSVDGGATWRQLFTSATIQPKVTAAGINAGVQGVTCVTMRFGKIFLASGHIILSTADTGKTWSVKAFPDSTAKSATNDTRKNISEIIPLNAGGTHLFALAADPGSRDAKLYQSTDGSVFTARKLIDSTVVKAPGDPAREAATFGQLLYMDANPAAVILVESQNVNGNNQMSQIFTSSDTGATFSGKCTGGKLPGTTTTIANLTIFEDPKYLHGYRITSGLNYSDEDFANWKSPGNFNGPALHGYRCHVPGTSIYMAFNEDAPYRTSDSIVGPWSYAAAGMSAVRVNQIAQHPTNMNLVYLATNSGIAITTKYTDTSIANIAKWQKPYGVFPMQPFGGMPSVGTISICPSDSSIVLAGGGNGILRAVRGGFEKADWTQDNFGSADGHAVSQVTGLAVDSFSQGGGGISSFAWYGKDTVFASFGCVHGNYGGVLISTDKGESFSVWQPLPHFSCNIIRICEDTATHTKMIYAGFGNRESSTNVPCMLWHSANGGATWDSCLVTGGSTNQGTHNTIYDLACGKGTIDTIFLATEFGIAMSTDTGATAQIIPMPMQAWEMCAVAVDKSDKHKVYIASREKIYLLDWSNPADRKIALYYAALPGEIISDLLFDELTMSSSAGFFALDGQADIPTSIGQVTKTATTGEMKILRATVLRTGCIEISYSIAARGAVSFSITNLAGRTVGEFRSDAAAPGTYTERFTTSSMARGLYLLSVRTATTCNVRPFMVTR